jgi:hypothetical protein
VLHFLRGRASPTRHGVKPSESRPAGPPIVFIHSGYHHYPAYTFLHAVEQGFDVHVIADRSWSSFPDVTFHDIAEFAPATNAFRSAYRHRSPHNPAYEMFCFERWFILSEFAARHGLDELVCADSDVLPIFYSADC